MTRSARDTSSDSTRRNALDGLDPGQALDRIRKAGIVGMGGGGFPSHVKYAAQVDTVLANGAECEPLLWSDKNLMLRWPDEVVRGVEAVMALTSAAHGVIAVKEKYPDVVEALERAVRARRCPDLGVVEVHPLRNVYPAGDEVFLIRQVLSRTVPELRLPLDVGVVVNNVATLRAVARAVREEEPVTSRLVTVTGHVRRPCVVEAPVGTELGLLLEAAGGTDLDDFVFIKGGPMMGVLVEDGEDPVLKTTGGLIVLPPGHPVVARRTQDPMTKLKLARSACCLCMECTEVCPRNLVGHGIFPHRLMQNVAAGISNDMQAYAGALLCCECGLCTVYGCPMGLDPARMNVEVKRRLKKAGVRYEPSKDPETSPFFAIKQVPVSRLLGRLLLTGMDRRLELLPEPVRPERVSLMLSQGATAPATPVVGRGDRVKKGDPVGSAGGHVSAALHASIDGVVAEVTDKAVILKADGGNA